ncbi:MAG: M13 family metallopeptidase [Gemmatimonadaceae bacterium]|nr:M13 family metallopeptidase [Gemmatimonadaceae bacterium]
MTPFFRRAALALALFALAARGAPAQAAPPTHGIDPANIDTTCSACADFYQYANGSWLKRTEIPAAYTQYSTFREVADRADDVLHSVLEDAATGAKDHSTREAGIYYASCMDTTSIETKGMAPLTPRLASIDAISSLPALRAQVAQLQMIGVPVMFNTGSEPDFKNSEREILALDQGGLGLPDRDYYTRTDSTSAKLRDTYVDHIGKLLVLAGEAPAQASHGAGRVLAIETELAKASMTNVERRDPKKLYNPMSLAQVDSLAPHLAFSTFLRSVHAPTTSMIRVGQPAFLRTLDTMLTTVPLADWKAYLRYHSLSDASPWLSKPFADEAFRMQQAMTGAKEQLPRWKRCLASTSRSLGEAVGQAYVARTFTPEAKARALAMVRNMEAVLRERLSTLAWMSDSTRKFALAKLDAFVNKIGYPDKWRDYSKLDLSRQSFVANRFAVVDFESRRDLAKVGKPTDRTEWGMEPAEVNAQYNPLANDVTFPAAILQPPFFDPNADDAVNYGGMGAAIGHEMTHGFDDEGRQFDAAGNLKDWWTGADAKAFDQRALLVQQQFDGYVVLDSLHVNGKLTLGEDIADLGGLKIAYEAMERSFSGKRPAPIDGFTPEQRFFLSWAQIWREKARPEAERQQVLTDPHAPSHWRVNGPLANMPEFAAAFGCKAGDMMVRPDSLRPQIW